VDINWTNFPLNQITFYYQNGFGCVSDTAALHVEVKTIGLEEPLEEGIFLHPNPASHTCYVTGLPETNALYEIKIVDIAGKVCHSRSARAENGSLSIDISTLPQGSYVLSVANANNSFKNLLVVQKH